MGMGNLRYTVTFYPNTCLVHVNLAPLVVTLVHKDGGDETPNFGYTLDMVPDITSALEPLRLEVKEHLLEAGRGQEYETRVGTYDIYIICLHGIRDGDHFGVVSIDCPRVCSMSIHIYIHTRNIL